jgi:hypothetical protein
LNDPGNPTPIAFGQTLSGSISTPAEMDTFTFTAGESDLVLVSMSKASGNLWPRIQVYDPNGNMLCEEASSVTAEIYDYPLPGPGIYTILAGDGFNGTYTGGYKLHVRRSTDPYISQASYDGWILESSEASNKGGASNKTAATIYLGDNAQKKQYRSILSFDTKYLPDNAEITKVTLKVRKQGVVGGGNPVNTFQGFMIDVKKGFFGPATGLQVSDFQASADKSYGPFKPAPTNGWYTINLTTAKAYINLLDTNGGVTQLRLRFKLDDNNNAVANDLKLYSGNAPAASRPQLIIEYNVP